MKIKYMFCEVEKGTNVAKTLKEAVAMSVMFETNVRYNFNDKAFEVKYNNLLAQVRSLEEETK